MVWYSPFSMKVPSRSDWPGVSLPTLWSADLSALLKPEDTEHARGFNAGIQAVLELLSHHEQKRQLLSKKGLKRVKAEGKKTGGLVPYGYQLAADRATLLINPEEQRIIALARELRKSHSLRSVARELRKKDIFPRGYDPKKDESPQKFEAVQIKRMLENTGRQRKFNMTSEKPVDDEEQSS